jgi:VanZ family protein
MKNFFRYWLPAAAYMAFIYYLSSRSQFPVQAPDWFFFADKVVHTVLYAGLGFFVLRALIQGDPSRVTLGALILAAIITSLYGVSDEFHQSFVPGRTPDVYDWMTDTLGAFLACAYFYWRKTRLRKQPA